MGRAAKGDLAAAEDAAALLADESPDATTVGQARRLLRLGASGTRRAHADRWYRVWELSLRWLALSDFRCYMEYLELDRPPEERFWLPRRRALGRVADALQSLSDGRLDELIVNLPPRVGKTQIVTFWLTWEMGRHPSASRLYTSFSAPVTKSFYTGVLEVVRDPDTYRWADVFPSSPVVRTDANDEIVDCGRRKKYASLTCRSIDGTLNGACDASGCMVGDDLCSGIEEAANPDRMRKLNSKVNNDWLSRRKQGCPVVWMGTRWSLLDPMGQRERLLSSDPRFKRVRWRKVSVPALDSRDRSNFAMDYGVGFSTDDYRRIRAQFERDQDQASWLAMYQQAPIERQGALFEEDALRHFSGAVPEGRTFMAVDPAFGGGDFTAAPVCVDTGQDVYVPDVVFSDREKDVTIPMLADAVEKWRVEQVQFEANRTLQSYIDEFRRELASRGLRCTVLTQPASTKVSKDERIHGRAPDIRAHMLFVEPAQRTRDYAAFMRQVCAFTSQGRVPHDDAPDSLAMAADMVWRLGTNRATTFARPV